MSEYRRGYKPVYIDAPALFKPSGLADLSLDAALRRHVAMVLDYCEGDRIWAAEELGVNASTMWRWTRRWARGPKQKQVHLKVVAR